MPITEAYIKEIERKIDEGGNGDVDRMELQLMLAIYQEVKHLNECVEETNKRLDDNPAFALSEMAKKNKGVSTFFIFIVWLLSFFIPQLLIRLMGIDSVLVP